MSPERKGIKPELTQEEHKIALLSAFLDDPTLVLGDVHIPAENPNDPKYCSIVLFRTKKQGENEVIEQFSASSVDFGILFDKDFKGLGLLSEGSSIQNRYANYLRATSHIIGAINERT